MTNAEETRRQKARNLRYKKPISKDLNLDSIQSAIWEIQEACDDVQCYIDGDDETLLNALDGDEDDAYEFKMMFSDLTAAHLSLRNRVGKSSWTENFVIKSLWEKTGIKVNIITR